MGGTVLPANSPRVPDSARMRRKSSQVEEGLEAATVGKGQRVRLWGCPGDPAAPQTPARSPVPHLGAPRRPPARSAAGSSPRRRAASAPQPPAGQQLGRELDLTAHPVPALPPTPSLAPTGAAERAQCRPQGLKLTVPEMAPDVKLIMNVASSRRACLQSHSLTSS